MHALIICEDARFAELLTVALRQVGLRGVVRRTAPQDAAQLNDAAIVLVNASGFEGAAQGIRTLNGLTSAPVLILCPQVDEASLLDLYQRGATIVCTKPCDLRIVAAQAAGLTRLVAAATISPAPHPLLDPDTKRIDLPNGRFRLTTLEFRLLAALLDSPGRVFTPERLVEHVWGYSGEGDRNLVKGLVNRVRRKIEPAPQKPIYLVTEAGVGYRFVSPEREDALSAIGHGISDGGKQMAGEISNAVGTKIDQRPT